MAALTSVMVQAAAPPEGGRTFGVVSNGESVRLMVKEARRTSAKAPAVSDFNVSIFESLLP